jgi:uncharacterized protein YeaO (DUF488 family)
MLYLATLDQRESAKGLTLSLTREKLAGMSNLPDLCPSRRLISRYRSGSISWQEFRENYLEELRGEYKRSGSRLRGLAEYARDKDVTLFVPDDDFHVGYLTVLGEAVDGIWRSLGVKLRVQRIFQEREIVEPSVPEREKAERRGEPEREMLLLPVEEAPERPPFEIPKPFSEIPSLKLQAAECEFFQGKQGSPQTRNCYLCIHFDDKIVACMRKNILLIEYEWGEPEV